MEGGCGGVCTVAEGRVERAEGASVSLEMRGSEVKRPEMATSPAAASLRIKGQRCRRQRLHFCSLNPCPLSLFPIYMGPRMCSTPITPLARPSGVTSPAATALRVPTNTPHASIRHAHDIRHARNIDYESSESMWRCRDRNGRKERNPAFPRDFPVLHALEI